jgi:hypothetical protein
MCQHIVFGMDCGTRKLAIVSDTGVLWKKSLFYGQVEAYFAVYDSVVLTGPFYSSSGTQTVSTGHVATENQGVRCSQPLKASGLPLNSMECEGCKRGEVRPFYRGSTSAKS